MVERRSNAQRWIDKAGEDITRLIDVACLAVTTDEDVGDIRGHVYTMSLHVLEVVGDEVNAVTGEKSVEESFVDRRIWKGIWGR